MAVESERCDSVRDSTGRRCPNIAEWWVGIGDRQIDRQKACANHLTATCRAMWGAEGRRSVGLKVIPL